MSHRIGVLRATLVVMVATGAVKLCGMAKQVYIAARFGTTSDMDGFVIAFLLPMLLAGLISGSFHSSLIPLYIEKKEKKGQREADDFFFSILVRGGLALLLLSVLLSVLSPLIIPLLGWGFDGQTLGVSISLARMLAFFILFEGFIALMAGALNARARFALPALTPVIMSVSVIAFLFFFQRIGIRALALGNIFGALLGAVCLCLVVQRTGFPWRLRDIFIPVDWRRFGSMALPLFCGSAFASLNIVVDKLMASTLVRGSVSALNYANVIISAPVDLFIYAFATAILPFFSYQVVRGEIGGFKESFNRAVKAAAIILLPLTAGMITLGLPLVRLLFERGVFDARASLMTWQAAALFSLGLFPFAVGLILVRYLTATQNTFTIFKVALASVGVNVVGNYIFMQFLGHAGIALATSITYCFSCALLLMVVRRRLGHIIDKNVFVKIPKVGILAACSGVLGFTTFRAGLAPGLIGNLALGATVWGGSYFLMALVVEGEEIRRLLRIGRSTGDDAV